MLLTRGWAEFRLVIERRSLLAPLSKNDVVKKLVTKTLMKTSKKEVGILRPLRQKVDRAEARRRMKAFPKRARKIIESVKRGNG